MGIMDGDHGWDHGLTRIDGLHGWNTEAQIERRLADFADGRKRDKGVALFFSFRVHELHGLHGWNNFLEDYNLNPILSMMFPFPSLRLANVFCRGASTR